MKQTFSNSANQGIPLVNGSILTINVTTNVTDNNIISTSSWTIAGCSLKDSVGKEYCMTKCSMIKHCEVAKSHLKKWKNQREKVQFT